MQLGLCNLDYTTRGKLKRGRVNMRDLHNEKENNIKIKADCSKE